MSTDEIMKLVTECEDAATVLESYLMNADTYETQISTYDEARAALLKAVEEMAADAARYRAIRDGLEVDPDNSGIVVSLIDDFGGSTLLGENADDAIDEAMKGKVP